MSNFYLRFVEQGKVRVTTLDGTKSETFSPPLLRTLMRTPVSQVEGRRGTLRDRWTGTERRGWRVSHSCEGRFYRISPDFHY